MITNGLTIRIGGAAGDVVDSVVDSVAGGAAGSGGWHPIGMAVSRSPKAHSPASHTYCFDFITSLLC